MSKVKKAAAPVAQALPTVDAKGQFVKKLKDGKYLLLLVIPTVICLALFYYLPMYGLVIAFMDFNIVRGIGGSEWIGFQNFIDFFENQKFGLVMGNTLLLSGLSLVCGFPAPIILALLLNEVTNAKFKKFVQTISYMPHFYSTVIVVGLFSLFLAPTGGLITDFLHSIGVEKVNVLDNPNWFRPLYVISEIWQNMGWGAIVYLAALTNIDPQLYEAATVDGAGRMRCLWSITLPTIAPTVITMLLLNLGSILRMGYERAFLFQQDMNLSKSEIISTYVYKQMGTVGNQTIPRHGYGAAVDLFNSIISLILLITTNTISKKVSETSLW